MKYTTAALSLLALALSSTSSAQSLTDIPACALAPATNALSSSGCGQDIACICKNQNFIDSLRPVIQRDCSPEDFQKTLAFTESLCRSQNVPLSVSTSDPTTAAATETETASAPSASASNGSLHPGNSTGKPVTPSPQPAPASGATALLVRGVGSAGLVGAMVVGVGLMAL